MKLIQTRVLLHATAALAAACALAPALAATAAPAPKPADQAYQQQRLVCTQGQSNQDLATCLSEAVSARDQARRGQLQGDDAQTLAANALLRCRVHRVAIDRQACENMARGEGEVSGTAQEGGLIRQFTTLVPGTAPESVKDVAPAR